MRLCGCGRNPVSARGFFTFCDSCVVKKLSYLCNVHPTKGICRGVKGIPCRSLHFGEAGMRSHAWMQPGVVSYTVTDEEITLGDLCSACELYQKIINSQGDDPVEKKIKQLDKEIGHINNIVKKSETESRKYTFPVEMQLYDWCNELSIASLKKILRRDVFHADFEIGPIRYDEKHTIAFILLRVEAAELIADRRFLDLNCKNKTFRFTLKRSQNCRTSYREEERIKRILYLQSNKRKFDDYEKVDQLLRNASRKY